MDVKLLTTFAQISDMEHNAAYAMLTCHANTHKLAEDICETGYEGTS